MTGRGGGLNRQSAEVDCEIEPERRALPGRGPVAHGIRPKRPAVLRELTAQDGAIRLGTRLDAEDGPTWADAERFLTVEGDRAVVAGDRWSAVPICVYCDGSTALVASDPPLLLATLAGRGRLRFRPERLSFLLCDRVVPVPETVYEDVYLLGPGDRLELVVEGDRLGLRRSYRFPFRRETRRGTSVASTAALLEKLCASVERSLAGASEAALFLSSGKDSVALALALAELGVDATCVTYSSAGDADETALAASICRRLGLRHVVADLADTGPAFPDAIRRHYRHAPFPCIDPAELAYPVCAGVLDMRGLPVLDGTGNDTYFGRTPPPREMVKRLLCLGGGVPGVERVARWLPGRPVRMMARTRMAATGLSGPFLAHELGDVFRFAEDTRRVWRRAMAPISRMPYDEFRAACRSDHMSIGSYIMKFRNAATAFGWRPRLPWCDTELGEYVFHLPEGDRLGRRHWMNKVLLRELLRERLGRSFEKQPFLVDRASFIGRNRALVREEIACCPIWRKTVVESTNGVLAKPTWSGEELHRVQAMFQVSCWVNHARHARVSAAPALAETVHVTR